MKLQIYLHNVKMLLLAVIIAVAVAGPVAAQGETDEVLPTETAVSEVTATAAATEVVVPTEEVVIIPLEDFEEVALDQLDNAIVQLIQSTSLQTVVIFAIFGAFAGGVVFLLYRSSPADKQLSIITDAQPRVEHWTEVARERQREAQETPTPYDDIASSGLVAVLSGIEDLLKRQAELLKAQEQMQAQMQTVSVRPAGSADPSVVADLMRYGYGLDTIPTSADDEPAG